MARIFIAILSILLLNTSCINENNANCPKEYFIDVTTNNIENTKPEKVSILVYDNNDNLIGQHYSTLESPLDIGSYRKYDNVNLIALGSSQEYINSLIVPDFGSNVAGHNLALTSSNEMIDGSSVVLSPDDLFLGSEKINFNALDTKVIINKRIYIERHVSSMIITVKGRASNFADIKNYSFIINHTKDQLNYKGNLSGNDVVYKPKFTYDESKFEAVTPIFNTLHSDGEAISIDVYNGEQLIMKITKNSYGTPFKLEKGKLLNVLIEFKDSVIASFIVTNWGNAYIFEEFN